MALVLSAACIRAGTSHDPAAAAHPARVTAPF
jgi:hypothetical protein